MAMEQIQGTVPTWPITDNDRPKTRLRACMDQVPVSHPGQEGARNNLEVDMPGEGA